MSFREADKMTSPGGDPKPSILKAYIAVFPRRLGKNILSARQKSVVMVRGGGGTYRNFGRGTAQCTVGTSSL